VAKYLAETGDTSRTLRLIVRMADSSATAGALEVSAPRPLQVLQMAWDRAVAARDSIVTLSIVALHWRSTAATLEALRERSDSTRVAVPLDSLGLPGVVPLTGDTTRVTWVAKLPSSLADSARTMRLLVRLSDQTVSASLITVFVPLSPPARAPVTPGDGTDVQPKGRVIQPRQVGRNWAMDIQLDQPTLGRLELFDTQGRRVRTLLSQGLPAGSTVVQWDGLDGAGVRVPAGIYFARFWTPRATSIFRLVQLR
jgi:hypothetical protein